ncbi:MAG: hypothetical protein DSZ11_00335 [Sulfurovum sp.]|nr:MAG: hypothetical protein DSZ11_00335 [Sulfurovum sp.]
MQILGSLLILIYFNLSWLQAGSITSTVESKEILRGESVLLSIIIVGEKFDTLPDIPRIGGAKILGSHRSVQTKLLTVDGKAVMEQTSILRLEFKPTTSVSIPSFQVTIDGEVKRTSPIDITIVKERAKEEQEAKFLMEMNATKERVMVGEPLIVNIYFKQKKNIEVKRTEYKDPSFQGFISERIGDEKSYEEGNYTVHKLSYMLLVKEEGNITIDPVHVKVSYQDRKAKVGGWFSATPTWTEAKSLPLSIQAIPPSGDFDMMGQFTMKEHIDTQMVAPNKPVNLQLIVEGEGSLGDFDGVIFDIAGVTVYSDEAKIERKIIKDKLFSRYTKSYVFISDHDFIIPSKEMRVYNYNNKTIKKMRTKSYNIEIDGGLKSSASSTVHTKNGVDTESSVASTSILSKARGMNITWEVPPWMILFATFLLGSIVALILRPYLSRIKGLNLFGSKKHKINFDEALKILYPHINEDVEVENMVRLLYDKEQGKMVEIDMVVLENLVRYYYEKNSDAIGSSHNN